MKILSLFILFAASLQVSAQEMIVPAVYNTALLTQKNKKQLRSVTAKSDVILELPFIDDFSRDLFPGNDRGEQELWTGRQATRNTSWAINPPTVGVVSFDGADEFGYPYNWPLGAGSADTLTSCPIDLTGTVDDNIGLSFYYQPHGLAVPTLSPSTDSLFVEFYAPELDQWFYVWGTREISDNENFTFVYIPITSSNFLKEGFQFRFRNIAELQGALDLWHVDYVWLDRNGVNSTPIVNDVAFVRQEFTLLKDFTAMPLTHFAQNAPPQMKENVSVLLRNLNDGPRTLEGNRVRILHDGVEEGNFLNSNSPAIGPGALFDYNQSIAGPPNSFVFDPDLAENQLIFDVEFTHEVSDFAPTTSNDTIRFQQEFFTHYAYDDGSAEAGYSVFQNGQREAAIRYTSTINDSIWALQIYTMPRNFNYANTNMSIRIYESTLTGPGAMLGEALQTVQYGVEEYQESIIYEFEEPVFVPAGDFFVGYRESNQPNSLVIGLDFNTDANPGRLYWRVGGAWNPSGSPGSIMIRPMFTTPGYGVITDVVSPDFAEDVILYPNPTNTWFSVKVPGESSWMDVHIFDIGGRLVNAGRIQASDKMDISDLNPGIYLVQIADPSGNVATRKLAVSR
jgi:hypothetical protein